MAGGWPRGGGGCAASSGGGGAALPAATCTRRMVVSTRSELCFLLSLTETVMIGNAVVVIAGEDCVWSTVPALRRGD